MVRHSVTDVLRGLKGRLGDRLGRHSAPTPDVVDELAALKRETAQLRRRVASLDEEVQECRRLGRRLAELTDIVQELLLPMSQQDEAKVQDLLAYYTDALQRPAAD